MQFLEDLFRLSKFNVKAKLLRLPVSVVLLILLNMNFRQHQFPCHTPTI